LVAEPGPVGVVDNVCCLGDARTVVSVELARLVNGTVDRILDECGSPLGRRGPRFVGVAADQSPLSGCA